MTDSYTREEMEEALSEAQRLGPESYLCSEGVKDLAAIATQLLQENERLKKLLADLEPTIAYAMSQTWKPEDFAEFKRLREVAQ